VYYRCLLSRTLLPRLPPYYEKLRFRSKPQFWQISDWDETRVRFHGEQVKTSKAGDRATGENGDTCRTRVRPISATPEREAGDIAACSHVLPPDAQCHWSISQAQSRQRCEKRLKRLRRCFFLTIPPTLHEREWRGGTTHDWTPKEGQTGPYHSLEIVCSNTPRENNDPRSNRVEKSWGAAVCVQCRVQ
jgi:hypothetical protein